MRQAPPPPRFEKPNAFGASSCGLVSPAGASPRHSAPRRGPPGCRARPWPSPLVERVVRPHHGTSGRADTGRADVTLPLVVGISGATGVVYGIDLLRALKRQ